jgi:hypothetical protein
MSSRKVETNYKELNSAKCSKLTHLESYLAGWGWELDWTPLKVSIINHGTIMLAPHMAPKG